MKPLTEKAALVLIICSLLTTIIFLFPVLDQIIALYKGLPASPLLGWNVSAWILVMTIILFVALLIGTLVCLRLYLKSPLP